MEDTIRVTDNFMIGKHKLELDLELTVRFKIVGPKDEEHLEDFDCIRVGIVFDAREPAYYCDNDLNNPLYAFAEYFFDTLAKHYSYIFYHNVRFASEIETILIDREMFNQREIIDSYNDFLVHSA